MKQVVQSVRGGDVRVLTVPCPTITATEVLVASERTVLSPGTERAVRSLANASLVGKARSRPDLVRQVVRKARREGVQTTMRAVLGRLDEDMPLGYSGAGTVLQVGEFVRDLVPGQRVATGGGGKACHAEYQAVSAPLAVAVPDKVPSDEAAFATIGAIALHGLRLAEAGPGSRVGVLGLGLIGQLAVRIAQASGCEVAAVDVRSWTVARAVRAGAFGLVEAGPDTTAAILDWSRGRGLDAVIVAAATQSSDPMRRIPAMARDRANVVVVGDVGLHLDRKPLYEKEITLRFARSYGPGRYDRTYEEWGVDYPAGHVRWTEGRNLEAFLDLVAAGRLSVADLITHQFPIDEAPAAYQILEQQHEEALGVQLTYAPDPEPAPVVRVSARRTGGESVGLIGAGTFAAMTLLPAMQEAGFDRFSLVASASGLSAHRLAEKVGFERATSSADLVLSDPDVDVVVVATPHATHADFVARALRSGKHVFCEKPLALTADELADVASAWRAGPGQMMVGFNRRYAPVIETARRHCSSHGGPMVLTYRVNAGTVPDAHWYHDRTQGGRLIGEVCHFIDTCGAVIGAPVSSVLVMGDGRGEVLLQDDLALVLRYAGGSLATISYATGGSPSTPKERLEILGSGHSAVIDDFRRLTLDERPARSGRQDKGHVAELTTFRQLIAGRENPSGVTESALASMAVTLGAAESLLTGHPVTPSTP